MAAKSRRNKKKSGNYADWETFSFNLEENFFGIDKQYLLDYKSLDERLSPAYIDYSNIRSEADFQEKATRFLTRLAYNIFTHITEEKDAIINFGTDVSGCALDANRIYISLNRLAQTHIPYQIRVDSLAATIKHELYHKRFTVADLQKWVEIKVREVYYRTDWVGNSIKKFLKTKLHGVIHNILEDRRIERLGSKRFPGYAFYFEQKRKYGYYVHYQKEIQMEFINGIIIDYLLIKILLPELEKKFLQTVEDYTDKVIIHELEELNICKETIRLIKEYIESTPQEVFSDFHTDIMTATNHIWSLIPEKTKSSIEAAGKTKELYINITEEAGTQNKNGEFKTLSREESDTLLSIISDELKVMAGDDASNDEKRKLEKIPFENNFTKYSHFEIIEEAVPSIDTNMLNDARRMGKSILGMLGFLDSKFNRIIENYELSEGEIDESDLYSLGMGNRDIFEEIEPNPGYSLDFGILLDESGSMTENIREAKTAVLSLLLAMKDNSNINLFVFGHTANVTITDEKTIQIYKYYNSLEKKSDWKRIFAAKARSNNADGFAIQKAADIMSASKSRNKVLVVVSDGYPHANNYGGEPAEEHVKNIVDTLEAKGIMVIQLCMDNIESSSKMFNHYIEFTEDGTFFEKLKNILLNKLTDFTNQI